MKKQEKKVAAKFNSKWLGFVVTGVLVVLVCCSAVFVFLWHKKATKDRTLEVGFFGLPQEISATLKEKLSVEYSEEIVFKEFSADSFTQKNAKNCNLVFMYDGSSVASLEKNADLRKVPEEASLYLPGRIQRENGVVLPVLLDHWEIAYNRGALEAAGVEHPLNYNQFVNALEKLKGQVFVPLFVCGSEDDTILAFVGAFVESFGSEPAYSKLLRELSGAKSLDEIVDKNLLEGKEELSLRMILESIKEWQLDGRLYEKWYSARETDLVAFGNDGHIGSYFTSLSKHRQLPYNFVSQYDADRVPVVATNTKHGIMAPSVVCLNLSVSDKFDSIITSLVEPVFQKDFSEKTKLAPVSSRAVPYDTQANDVRFLTAACPAGQLPDLCNGAMQFDLEKQALFAQQLRNYFKGGVFN
ncbi:MAG: hypothetical protein MJ188_01495 [Treponema sp.]|nr:hypothetical protein [Treponema sp.]